MAAACQGLLIVAFVGAALTKLGNLDQFFRALAGLPWLSLRVARPATRVVPISELVIAALLAVLPRIGAVVSLAALTLFTTIIAMEVAAGRSFHCGCFGGMGARPVGPATIARNAFLAGAAITLLVLPYSIVLGALLSGLGLGLCLLLAEIAAETLRMVRET